MIKPFGFAATHCARINAIKAMEKERLDAETLSKKIIDEATVETDFKNTYYWARLMSDPSCHASIAEDILGDINKSVEASKFLKIVGVREYIETELKSVIESLNSLSTPSEDIIASYAYVKALIGEEKYDAVMHFPYDTEIKTIKTLTCIALFTEFCCLLDIKGNA